MTTDSSTPPSGETPPSSGETPSAPGATPDSPADVTSAQQTPIDSLPQDIQDLIKRTRGEAAQNRRERDEARVRAQGYEQEKMTETERLQAQATSEKERADVATASLMRFQVAAAKGISGDAIDFLTGSTQEELEQSADKLKALMGERGSTPSALDFGAGARPAGSNGSLTPSESFSATLRRAAGRP